MTSKLTGEGDAEAADDDVKKSRGEYFIFFWKFYPMPNHDIKNSTLASKVMFWTLPLIKCKTHQIWPTLKWKSWFFRFFSSFFTKNPSFLDKFYPSQKNSRNYTGMHIPVFCKIFTPGPVSRRISSGLPNRMKFCLILDNGRVLEVLTTYQGRSARVYILPKILISGPNFLT